MARALLLHTCYYRTEREGLPADVQDSHEARLPLILFTVDVSRHAMEETIPDATLSCDKRTKA